MKIYWQRGIYLKYYRLIHRRKTSSKNRVKSPDSSNIDYDQREGLQDTANEVSTHPSTVQTEEDDENIYNPQGNFASVYDRYGKGNGYAAQYQKKMQEQQQYQYPEKKIGFYNFAKSYQTEAIIEAPDEGDY